MKKLLSILFLVAISFTTNAQTVIVPLDASGSGVTGGDGTGTITSAVWSGVNLPAAAPFTDKDGKTGSGNGLLTYVAISKEGTYNFQLTVKDNKGHVQIGTLQIIAKAGQQIIIKIVQPVITIYLN